MTATGNKFLRRTVYEDLTPEQVVERYVAGRSMEDIGFATGTSGYLVRQILVERGVAIRPSCGHRGHSVSRYVSKS